MERSVLITGAGSGVGLATVLRAATLGFRCLAAVHADEEAELVHTAAAGAGAGSRLETVSLDLADEEARRDALAGRRLYGLVNCAGYLNPGELGDVSLVAARRQLEVMVVAPLHLARLAAPHMIERGEGRIVNVLSEALATTVPLMGWYRAAKAALAALSDTLRLELAPDGVDVVAIAPGGLRTPLWDGAAADLRRRLETTAHPRTYERALTILQWTRPHMASPETVAALIGDVLVSGRPRRRYRVGADAAGLAAAGALVPAPIRDAVAAGIGRVGER